MKDWTGSYTPQVLWLYIGISAKPCLSETEYPVYNSPGTTGKDGMVIAYKSLDIARPERFDCNDPVQARRTTASFSVKKWSGWRESNPRMQLGKLPFCHWTTPACLFPEKMGLIHYLTRHLHSRVAHYHGAESRKNLLLLQLLCVVYRIVVLSPEST